MTTELEQFVLANTAASGITDTQIVQSLWSGYGQIIRFKLAHSKLNSVVVKCIDPPQHQSHPRGWNTNVSMQRKLRSYEVEAYWYRHFAADGCQECVMPRLIASKTSTGRTWLILDDLDSGFPLRRDHLQVEECVSCLQWLARFHAQYFQCSSEGLWPTGTYWHLATRQDELAAMSSGTLKNAAAALDSALENCQFKTLVHGDAKLANFCFSADAQAVAMVDFQYVGGGCGIRDVAYFLGSCLAEKECEQHAERLLGVYFAALLERLPTALSTKVEAEWRALYPIAWADFHRFLAGWMPQHKKINRYTQAMTSQALAQLASEG